MLTQGEKELARRVVHAFRMNVCGFDLLRTPSGSYVCDVNGWSFVKKSAKYYDDAASIIMQLCIRNAVTVPGPLAPAFMGGNFASTGSLAAELPPLVDPAVAQPGGESHPSDLAAHPISPDQLRVASMLSTFSGPVGKPIRASIPPRAARERVMSIGEFVGSKEEELRCVLAVIRHGDRTPK